MMNKFDEVETYILERWGECIELENRMKELRRKKAEVLSEVFSRIRERNCWGREFDGKPKKDQIRFGKRSWTRSWEGAFYLEMIDLDHIFDESSSRPRASFYVYPKKKVKKVSDLQSLAAKIRKRASSAIRKFPKDSEVKPGSGYVVAFDLPESRQDMRKMLLSGDLDRYVEMLVGHADTLATMIPAIDSVLSEK